jgi:aspartyl protease family protein
VPPLSLPASPTPYLIAAIVIVVLVLGRRVRFVGIVINLAVWAALIAALVMVLGQRERLDPYLTRFTQALDLDGQKVEGSETRIRMSPDGHFWARVRFAGVERRMLIDSGATITAIAVPTAAAAGLTVRDQAFPVVLQTANGAVRAQTSAISELRIGNIVARDVPVVVSPAFGDANVLGMNFLSRLKSWRVEGRTLVLVPHHPQSDAERSSDT